MNFTFTPRDCKHCIHWKKNRMSASSKQVKIVGTCQINTTNTKTLLTNEEHTCGDWEEL